MAEVYDRCRWVALVAAVHLGLAGSPARAWRIPMRLPRRAPSLSGLKGRPQLPRALANRRRRIVRSRDARLGKNAEAIDSSTGLENPAFIRNQDKLAGEAARIARDSGDQIVGPAYAYYRTNTGRLLRSRPNAGTGSLRDAAKLRGNERLASLEEVGFVTEGSRRLLRVSTPGSHPRLTAAFTRPTRAVVGVAASAGFLFGRDMLRWIGIREGARVVDERVTHPDGEGSPEVSLSPDGEIVIDGDGDGEDDLVVQPSVADPGEPGADGATPGPVFGVED